LNEKRREMIRKFGGEWRRGSKGLENRHTAKRAAARR